MIEKQNKVVAYNNNNTNKWLSCFIKKVDFDVNPTFLSGQKYLQFEFAFSYNKLEPLWLLG